MKKYEEVTFADDLMFGAVLYRYPDIAAELTEKITGRKIREIIYIEREKTLGSDPLLKKIRMDVRFEDDEAVYCVEMQTYREIHLPKRLRYYSAVNDIEQITAGGSYGELKPTYVIFICNYDPFGLGLRKYTFRSRADEDISFILKDESVKIVLNTKGDPGNMDDGLNRLLDYVNTGNPADELTCRIEEAVKHLRNDREWRKRYMTYHLSFRHEWEVNEIRTKWNLARRAVSMLKNIGMEDEMIRTRVTEELVPGLSDKEYDVVLTLKEDLTEDNDQIVRDWLERQ